MLWGAWNAKKRWERCVRDCLSQIDMWPISPSLSIEGVKRPQLSISSIERKINCLYSGKLRASSFLPTAPCSCPNIGACGNAECCPGCTFSTDPDHCLFDKATFSSFCSRSSQSPISSVVCLFSIAKWRDTQCRVSVSTPSRSLTLRTRTFDTFSFIIRSRGNSRGPQSFLEIGFFRLCSLDLISLCLVPFLCTSNCKLMVRSVYLPTYENDLLAQQFPLYFLPPVHFIQKELFSWRGNLHTRVLNFSSSSFSWGFF